MSITMNRLQNLRQSRTNGTSLFAKYINLKRMYKSSLFCCYEGEDVKYYSIRLNLHITKQYDRIIPFDCSGKKEVIRFYELVYRNSDDFDKKKVIAFVDHDFDASIKDNYKYLYETPCYSIENFYTSRDAFLRILESEFGLLPIDKEYLICLDHFINRQKEFHSKIALFNAFIACQRMMEELNLLPRLNLNSFNLNKIISEISVHKITGNYTIQDLYNYFPNSIVIPEDMLYAKLEELNTDPQKRFRGKYEVEFIYLFLMSLIGEFRDAKSTIIQPVKKIKLNLSKKNILSELSQYADTPDCLLNFIKNNI